MCWSEKERRKNSSNILQSARSVHEGTAAVSLLSVWTFVTLTLCLSVSHTPFLFPLSPLTVLLLFFVPSQNYTHFIYTYPLFCLSFFICLQTNTRETTQKVLNRKMDNRMFASLSQVPLPQLMPSGSRKDCIRLRGLPYDAHVEQILEFLSEFAKNIVYQGVHMVYNAQVRGMRRWAEPERKEILWGRERS